MKDLKEQLEDKIKEGASIKSDQQSAQVVKQAIKDDQALAPVAKDIQVTVKDGAITLDGQVDTKQQMNLATNTAKALGGVDQVNNRMEITYIKTVSNPKKINFVRRF
jgi:osmotically-inducible protein OsmY